MRITPLDIQQKQFKKVMRGFEPEDVQTFLELVRTEFEELVKENNALKDELRRRLSEIDEYKDRERTLKSTMLTAQKIAEDIKENAKKDAELIVAEAQVQADRIVNNAHSRMVKIIDEISELKRQRATYEANLRNLLETHGKLLDITVAESEEVTREADKVQFLPRKPAKPAPAPATNPAVKKAKKQS